MFLARQALQLLLSLCTLCSLPQAFAHDCDTLLGGASAIAYVNLVGYAVDRGILPASEFHKLSESATPINPLKTSVLANNANLSRALALTVERMSDEDWREARASLISRADRAARNESVSLDAKAVTQPVFALLQLPQREGLERLGEIHATRDGRVVAVATLNGRLGRYSLLDDEFVSVLADHVVTMSALYESKSGKILLAAITGSQLRVFDVTKSEAKQILERDLKTIPHMKEMFANNHLRVYEPMFFETLSGVHVFMHARESANFYYVDGKAVLPVATISLNTGRVSSELLSPQISKFNRDAGHIYASGWLKDWTQDGKQVALVARDVSHKRDIVAHDRSAYEPYPSINDPTLKVLSNHQIGMLPDTGEPSVFDPVTGRVTKIEKGERFHLSTTQFFVREGKTWFAALDLNDVVHSEARLVYGPAAGEDVHLVRIPMRAPMNQVDRFERIEHNGKTYFVIVEAGSTHYARLHIYDESEQHLTSLEFPHAFAVAERVYRKTEILPDGRWIALFTSVKHDRPLFLQIFGPVPR